MLVTSHLCDNIHFNWFEFLVPMVLIHSSLKISAKLHFSHIPVASCGSYFEKCLSLLPLHWVIAFL